MKKTFIAFAALGMMAACTKENIETPEVEYGYINLGLSAETEILVTKGTTPSEAELNNYNITIMKGAEQTWAGEYSEIKAGYKVAEGTYTVSAVNLTPEEAYNGADKYGYLRVAGENSVTVSSGKTSDCAIECSPINSKVSFVYTPKFAEVFDLSSLRLMLDETGRNLHMEVLPEGNSALHAAYYEPGQSLGWKLSAAVNGGSSKDYTGTCSTTAGKWTVVKFDTGSTGAINITITVSGDITVQETITETINPL